MSEGLLREIEEAVKETVGIECQALFDKVEKNNGVTLQSLVIKEPGKDVALNIYIDEMMETLGFGTVGVQDVVDQVARIYRENKGIEGIGDFDDIAKSLSKEMILKGVTYQLVNREKNESRLMQMPHITVLDLAAIYRVIVSEDGSGTASFVVSHILCKKYGISFGELDAAARVNTERKGFRMQPITAMLAGATGMTEEIFAGGCHMWVLTNGSKTNGAAVMLYPGYFKKLAQKMGSGLYILPSSIHELITVPVGVMGPDGLREMVMEINAVEVDETEFLSDNVYRYSLGTGVISVA